ncbi:ribose-phosphate pyrophosphokinase [Candidatus Berkelbacteria bacterium]|nr:ribose-phosphate pyrophosphokinase [Candidatus Berkelbacteria bacterium]
MPNVTIIPTLHAEHLARLMSVPKDCEIVFLEGNKDGKRFFPDGEVYVKLQKIELNKRIVILHTGAPDPNAGIIELEMLLNILTNLGYKNIEIFFSYFPYGMQDNPKYSGETNAAENLIIKLVDYYHIKQIYVLDAHFFGQPWFGKYPIKNISATPMLKDAALIDYPSAIFLAPDQGSQRRMLLQGTAKKRINSFEIDIVHDENFIKTVKNQTVGVIDDLVETGGTAVKFAELCQKIGAKDVIALVTHGLLDSGTQRLKKSYSKLYLTNSIDCADTNIDVSVLILNEIVSN